MKKTKYCITWLLCLIFVFSMATSVVMGIINKVNAGNSVKKEYYELSYKDLDNITNRLNKIDENEAPHITVFTYGCGDTLAQWSNNLTVIEELEENVTDENAPTTEYEFTYEPNSIIDKFQESLGETPSVLFKASVKIDLYETSVSDAVDPQSYNNGAIDLRRIYDPTKKSNKDITPDSEYDCHNDFVYTNSPASNTYIQLVRLDRTDYSMYDTYENDDSSLIQLTEDDVSKHIIILFDVNGNSANSNDFVYAQFEYVLDCISYQYFKLTNGRVLPVYNLIGHSRGGLTNLQYAMGHPNNVASLYSMGTPYNGSDFGSAEIGDYHPFLEMSGMDLSKKGVQDILEYDLYKSYRDCWNEGYKRKYYSHITFVPIGTYVTSSFVFQLLIDHLVKAYGMGKKWENICRKTVNIIEGISLTALYLNPGSRAFRRASNAIGKIKNIINRFIPENSEYNAWLSILNNITTSSLVGVYKHIGYTIPTLFLIEDDLFIDLDSQIARGYKGADVRVNLMGTEKQKNNKRGCDREGVAHNLETHDKDIISYIVNHLEAGKTEIVEEGSNQDTSALMTSEDENGTIFGFTKLNGKAVVKYIVPNGTSVSIPDTLDDCPVIAVDAVAYDSQMSTYGMRSSTVNQITEIRLPDTLERIDAKTFAGMPSLETVIIEAPVNSTLTIDNIAFKNNAALKSVVIENAEENNSGTVIIDSYAFEGCINLENITVTNANNSTTNVIVKSDAFSGCSSLSNVDLGNATEIGYGAFAGCTSLTSITIPATVTKIDGFAFYNSGISNLNFEAGSQLTEIGYGAFAYTPLNKLTIGDQQSSFNQLPASLTLIGDYAFAMCSQLGNISVPNSVTTIGEGAFMNATALTSVDLGDNESTSSLTSIGDLAFYGCTSLYLKDVPNVNSIGSLAFAGCNWTLEENETSRTLTIPASVQSIGAGAFYGCSQIAGFSLASGNSYFHVVDGVLYVKQTNADGSIEYYLHTYPTPKEASGYTAIDSLVGVLDYAFAGNVKLTTINLANVQDIGENAFEDCTKLTTITVDSTNEYYSTSDGVLFNKDVTCLIYYPLGKTNSSYTIPTTVTEITAGTFAGNTYLTTINIDSANEYYSTNDGVLFNKDATCLIYYPLGKTNQSYTVYTTVTEITAGAFAGNTNLISVNLKNVQIVGNNAFEGCTNLATITGNSVIEAHSSAFEGTAWYNTQSQAEYFGLGKVLFKYNGSYDASGVLDLRTYAAIEENAFPSLNEEGEYIPNTQLTTVYLGEDYSQFNHVSFNNCTALNKVYLLNSEVVQINALTDTLKEQLTFYVPYSLYSSYTATYEDLSFEAIETTINFYVGEELLDTQIAYYGEVFTTDKVPTVTGNNIFLGWYDTTAYTSTFVGSTYEEFEAEDDLYAKILPTYTLRFVTGIATTCSDITGVYEGKTVRLPNVTQLNYSGSWMNNGANYAFNANMVFFPGAFIVEENNVITFTAAWTTCTHGSKKYVSTSSSTHNVICNTCGYTTSSSHMWSMQSNGTYKCRFCKYVTAIIPINPLKVEDEEIIQSLGEAEEGEIITAPNGLSYIYLNGEFYLVTQQDDLLFIPKKEESE